MHCQELKRKLFVNVEENLAVWLYGEGGGDVMRSFLANHMYCMEFL